MELPCPCHTTNVHMTFLTLRWRTVLRWFSEVLVIIVDGWRVIRQEKIGHIIISPLTGSGNMWLAMCLLHWLTRIPISLYLFDMFSQMCNNTFDLRIRRLIERKLIPVASQVFVNSKPLGDLYKQRLGANCIVLHNPIEYPSSIQNSHINNNKINSSTKDIWKIVFTGMIYELHQDPLINLIKVIDKLSNVELHLYTPVTEDKLRWRGIFGKRVIYHGFVSSKDALEVQASADILFLPISFESEDMDFIRTASPTKLTDYLASGQVILINAPNYSYASWYGKKFRCAEVVNKSDVDMCYKAVSRLINDKNYREHLIANAKIAAKQHESKRVSLKLQRHLSIA